jgi:hypothetical protein
LNTEEIVSFSDGAVFHVISGCKLHLQFKSERFAGSGFIEVAIVLKYD